MVGKNSARCKEILAELIAFPTVSADSNLALIDYAESLLQKHGYDTGRFPNADGSKANLLARIGPEVAGGIALAGHTDVVPVSGQDWQTDPFELVQQNGEWFGRGTADMKGFIAVALAAATGLDAGRLKKPLHLILTYDEEVGCLGAMALRDELAGLADRPRLVLIGEPTDMQLVTAHKGIQNIRTTIRGKPGHSSRPAAGASAIVCAAKFIEGIGAALPADMDEHFDPPGATFNVGRIRGGEAVNIIPEWCELRWEFRHLPGQDPGAVHAALESLSGRLRGEIPGVAIATELVAGVPGLQAGANRELASELRAYLDPPEAAVSSVPFVTEGGIFQQAGIPAVICGPGRLDQAHQPNERVSVQSMNAYRDFLGQVIAGATT
jgi:acetylornithine deacetylase